MTCEQPHGPFGRPQFDFLPKLLNGGIAGICGTALVFPLDLTKTRIQNQVIGPNGERTYKSLIDCIGKIIKAEGPRGLYRGCLVTLVFIAPEKGLKLSTNDLCRYYLQSPDKSVLSFEREILAGGLSGCAQSLISTPMDLMKIQLQDAGRLAAVNHTAIKKLSALDVALEQLKTKGFLGLYRGIGPTTFRNAWFSIVYFPMFFKINSLGPRKNNFSEESVPYWPFVSGCFAGCIAAGISTPLDVVKTRIQRLTLCQGDMRYSGTLDAFIKISRNEGPLALMKGAGIRMLAVAPLFGIFQTVYILGVAEYLISSVKTLSK